MIEEKCNKCMFFKESNNEKGLCMLYGQIKNNKICINYSVDEYDYF